MPDSGERPELLVDTSVAVALVTVDHEQHQATVAAVGPRSVGLAGHAVFETFSVLTRLPPPLRLTPVAVAELLARDFHLSCFLTSETTGRLVEQLGRLHIAGGAVYDALVGATAVAHDLPLASRDRRAVPTYRALGVDLELFA